MPAHLLELQEGGVHGEAAAPALRVLHPLALELETKVHTRFVITEKAPTRAFSWLKAATTAFTFKTLC